MHTNYLGIPNQFKWNKLFIQLYKYVGVSPTSIFVVEIVTPNSILNLNYFEQLIEWW